MTSAVDLSRRALAANGWKWLSGARSMCGWLVFDVYPNGDLDVIHVASGNTDYWEADGPHALGALPDLSDNATLGGIEHGILPELYGEHGSLWHSTTGWHYGPSGVSWGSGATKADALVSAMENAR